MSAFPFLRVLGLATALMGVAAGPGAFAREASSYDGQAAYTEGLPAGTQTAFARKSALQSFLERTGATGNGGQHS